MVTDDNRTPLWLWITGQPSWLRMITGLQMVTDDNRTQLWLRMTTGLHYGYG